MIRRHSQNLRPVPLKAQAEESLLAIRLKEALEKAKRAREPQPADG